MRYRSNSLYLILKGLVILLISNICYPLFFLHNVSNKCRHDFCVRKCNFELLVVSNIANQLVIKNLNLESREGKTRERREKHKLIQYYKMHMISEYLSSLVPPTVGSTVRYALRNEFNLQTVPAMSRQ